MRNSYSDSHDDKRDGEDDNGDYNNGDDDFCGLGDSNDVDNDLEKQQ